MVEKTGNAATVRTVLTTIDLPETLPVIFLVYRRPQHTAKSLDSIRVYRPSQLYVVGDGPKNDSEVAAVEETRRVIQDGVDWPCDIRWNLASQNMGLANRVSSGITWAFETCDKAVILEDDCVPDKSFFRFCNETLERYQNNQQITAVTGNNFQHGKKRGYASYYFSMFPHCWGWATWKDRWQSYDHSLSCWPDTVEFLKSFRNRKLVDYWKATYDSVMENKVDSWAFRWQFSCWARRGMTVTPNQNLVTNVGFDSDGTHCTDVQNDLEIPATSIRFPLRHPFQITRNRSADKFVLREIFGLQT